MLLNKTRYYILGRPIGTQGYLVQHGHAFCRQADAEYQADQYYVSQLVGNSEPTREYFVVEGVTTFKKVYRAE